MVNIPDGDVSKGQQVLPYQALRGGQAPQRHVLLLFIQAKALTVRGSVALSCGPLVLLDMHFLEQRAPIRVIGIRAGKSNALACCSSDVELTRITTKYAPATSADTCPSL